MPNLSVQLIGHIPAVTFPKHYTKTSSPTTIAATSPPASIAATASRLSPATEEHSTGDTSATEADSDSASYLSARSCCERCTSSHHLGAGPVRQDSPASVSPSSFSGKSQSGSRKSASGSPSACSSSSSASLAYCALCQQQLALLQSADSEETLKRADSRLTNSATVERQGSASTPQSAKSSSGFPPASRKHPSQPQQQQAQQFVEVDKIAAKGCACEECLLARQQEQLQLREQLGGQGAALPGPSGVHAAASRVGPPLSVAAGTSAIGAGMQMYACNGPTAMVPSSSAVTQTIEEQIKQIDRISKECDNSRKSLELINRRLDDLNDEVRRYREFLGHEKARRDPALYKTSTAEPLSVYNDNICRLIDSLTTQLTMEWTEKLRSIQNQTIAKFVSEKG